MEILSTDDSRDSPRVVFVDTTLRDGAQSPGVFFDLPTKVALVGTLSMIGVGEIEIGSPCLGEEEMEDLRVLSNLNVNTALVTWNRPVDEDILASISLGMKRIHLSFPVSDQHLVHVLKRDRRWVLRNLSSYCVELSSRGICASIGLEDASRADDGFLREVVSEARLKGACRVRFCDTVGVANPGTIRTAIESIASIGLPIETHCHDDLGMATANTLSAYSAGSRFLSTTISGIGERAGNASMEETVFALEYSLGVKTDVRLSDLVDVSRWLNQKIGRKISPHAPVLGSRIFQHTSGIHVNGVLKESQSYEPYPPEVTGSRRKIMVSHMTGRSGIRNVLERMGYHPQEDILEKLFPLIRHEGRLRKGVVPPQVIVDKYFELLEEKHQATEQKMEQAR